MLVFGANIYSDRAGLCAKRASRLAVHPSLERPSKIVERCLTEMITVGQRWPADRYAARINRVQTSGEIASAAQEIDLTGKLSLQAAYQWPRRLPPSPFRKSGCLTLPR